ncbi:unnamed protein product [Ilex paraguariensis]|uniref:NAC domain-containing protein n=1 Tax=Ilex paraguariensis TaxID=185542 RepID=A0ABC8TP79_9AQUA
MEVEDNSAVTNPSETHLNQDRTPPPNNSTNGFVNYLVASLPPGVCFQPSDQELAGFYLKRKLNKKPLPPNQIQELDEWVLCRIFNKVGRLNTTRNGLQDPNQQTKNSVQPQQGDKQHVQARDDSTMV